MTEAYKDGSPSPGTGYFGDVFKDIRYALRQLRRSPVFTAAAVLSLALSIGANVAIFNVLDSAVFKALPVHHPEELVVLSDPNAAGVMSGAQDGERSLLSYAEFEQLRSQTTTLSGLCAEQSDLDRWRVRIDSGQEEEARGRLVSEEYFSVLGVEPATGRFFNPDEAAGAGKDPYAVVSYDFWQRKLNGRSIGQGASIRLNNIALTVIGVAPPGFNGASVGENTDLWVPMMMEPLVKPGKDWLHEDLSNSQSKVMWLHAFGRLKPGMTRARVQSEMDVLFRRILEKGYPSTLSPETRGQLLNQRIVVRDARTGAFPGRGELSRQLMVLLAVGGLVLLIACANVANLLLAKATARYKEVGIRLSLGASRKRLMRQFLTESFLLSAFGGMAGLLIGSWASRVLLVVLSGPLGAVRLSTEVNLPVIAFAVGITLLATIFFGTAPAVMATKVDLVQTLREAGRGSTSSTGRITFAKSLVIAQVALSLLLVIGAGLFLRTLLNLQSVQLGYNKGGLLLIKVDGSAAGYKGPALNNLYHDVLGRLQALPDARSVAYSENGLFSGTESSADIEVEGFVAQRDTDRSARYDEVGQGYFSTLGIPMLLGREFGAQDTASSVRACIINEAFQKRFFAGRDPIGRHVAAVGDNLKIVMEVVGVAKDSRDQRLKGDVQPRFYASLDQPLVGFPSSVYFEIRTIGNPQQKVSLVRKTVLDAHSDLPVMSAAPVDELIDKYNSQPRMLARLCTVFGLVSLLLAAIGLYGVLSYGVVRRTSEIGIRMAMGAGRTRVMGMILAETGKMFAIGVAAGIIAAVPGTRMIATQLYGVTPLDPLTTIAAVTILGLVALFASCVPALRASRVDLITALRQE
jgi:predicted permease